ncbi:MAG: (2Fe-2S)-binding protein [Deltaproteobacteria bacterium]|uniref:(2Fe-2S)-binding protein n=1 Tax=Desulfobacula sp. TaxID=2593537 RepID=UPI001985D691|nr:(2Fe-2S)-binding protein [Candidatus Desulfobacula maris]MBL6993265.1 (2Fe-2S)-binding protein [Desulfobacula sp.]
MKKKNIWMNVNGEWHDLTVTLQDRLIDTLRDQIGLTGTKEGCGEGECGACTINLNGKAVLACLMLSVQADGAQVTTIEGLQNGTDLHPLQTAFLTESAVQCGYCTPGMIMAGHALIKQNPDPDKTTVKTCLANNLCRCTGYEQPVKAVLKAAGEMRRKIK